MLLGGGVDDPSGTTTQTQREAVARTFYALNCNQDFVGVAAANAEKGRLRQYRSAPFLMIPARQHFVIYDLVPHGIAVLTVQHQVRDIESLIADLTPAFHAEVDRLKRKA